MPVIPDYARQRQEDLKLETSLVYMLNPTEETKIVTYFRIPKHQEKKTFLS